MQPKKYNGLAGRPVVYSIASILIESGQTPCQVSRDAIAAVVVAVFANAHASRR